MARKFLKLVANLAAAKTTNMLDALKAFCVESVTRFNTIPRERQEQLYALATLLQSLESRKLIFICTHNSRRSHFGQIWSQIAAHYYGVVNVQTYSGGTEATAFHPNAIAALARAGCRIQDTSSGPNPRYEVLFDEKTPGMQCFSKVYNHPSNPSTDFVAIMTCNAADEACPIVQGASHRYALTYLDPKLSDGTETETNVYDERCQQIATEMLFLFSLIQQKTTSGV